MPLVVEWSMSESLRKQFSNVNAANPTNDKISSRELSVLEELNVNSCLASGVVLALPHHDKILSHKSGNKRKRPKHKKKKHNASHMEPPKDDCSTKDLDLETAIPTKDDRSLREESTFEEPNVNICLASDTELAQFVERLNSGKRNRKMRKRKMRQEKKKHGASHMEPPKDDCSRKDLDLETVIPTNDKRSLREESTLDGPNVNSCLASDAELAQYVERLSPKQRKRRMKRKNKKWNASNLEPPKDDSVRKDLETAIPTNDKRSLSEESTLEEPNVNSCLYSDEELAKYNKRLSCRRNKKKRLKKKNRDASHSEPPNDDCSRKDLDLETTLKDQPNWPLDGKRKRLNKQYDAAKKGDANMYNEEVGNSVMGSSPLSREQSLLPFLSIISKKDPKLVESTAGGCLEEKGCSQKKEKKKKRRKRSCDVLKNNDLYRHSNLQEGNSVMHKSLLVGISNCSGISLINKLDGDASIGVSSVENDISYKMKKPLKTYQRKKKSLDFSGCRLATTKVKDSGSPTQVVENSSTEEATVCYLGEGTKFMVWEDVSMDASVKNLGVKLASLQSEKRMKIETPNQSGDDHTFRKDLSMPNFSEGEPMLENHSTPETKNVIDTKTEELILSSSLSGGIKDDADVIVISDNIEHPFHPSPEKAPIDHSKKKLLILDINGLLADIVAPIPRGRKPDTIVSRKAVFSRPFCKDFLLFCFEKFDVGVWSSRMKKNVDTVLDILMGNLRDKLIFCWHQFHCTCTGFNTVENTEKPLVLKELKRLWEKLERNLPFEKGRYNESNTLLLDDSPYKALCNPAHTAIFPQSYRYSDSKDCSLGPGGDIRVYLEGLAAADNVQEYVKQNPFGQRPITEANPSWKYYSKILKTVS